MIFDYGSGILGGDLLKNYSALETYQPVLTSQLLHSFINSLRLNLESSTL
jgi:hypothetical protein